MYYQQPCPTCGGFHNQAETTIHFSPKIIEAYLRKLYGKKFDVETEIEPTIWREVLKYFNQACAEGISQSNLPPTLEQDFYSELKQSNGVFAAFKVHSMGNIMAEKLVDESGKLKPFRLWKEEVASIASHFVGPWLQTEYNTAVIRAHNAADWLNFERNKDIFPNLRWMPTTSPDPDEVHRVFWERKVTRPINDPFWNKHRPGDRWNCKCTLEATDDPITDIPGETNKERPQPGLKENPAKTKQIFDKSHPYFPKSCSSCPFGKRGVGFKNWFKNSVGLCSDCSYYIEATNVIRQETKKWHDTKPPKVEEYKNLHKSKVWASPYHGENEWDANKATGIFLSEKLGKNVYMLPRLDPKNPLESSLRKTLLPSNVPVGKNPDYFIGGMLFDGKSLLDMSQGKSKEAYRRSIQKRIKDGKTQADNIVLEVPLFVSKSTIKSAIKGYFSVSNKSRIIIVKHGDELYIYKKTRK